MHSVAFNQIIHHDMKTKNIYEDTKHSVMNDIHAGRIQHHEIAEIPIKYLELSNLPGVPEQNILTESKVYKPFRYQFAYNIWLRQQQIHWLHEEIPLINDVRDWKGKLTEGERNLMTHIFRLFVQNDLLINNAYIHHYAPIFKPNELQLAISAVANMESIHEVAYSYLLTELGIPDSEYSAFLEYKEMLDKYNFTAGHRMDSLMGIAVALVVFGGLTEGVQLFASFAALLNFPRFNKLKGMGQIVALSVRDESLHVEFAANIYHTFMNEYEHLIDKEALKELVYNAVRKIVGGEFLFTDLAFEMGPVEGMSAEDMKKYILNIADMRLEQFGFDRIFNEPENPFEDWINRIMRGIEHANFFEQKGSDYSKGSPTGTWTEAFAD